MTWTTASRRQVGAIWLAQWRTYRNHLPRRSWGSVLGTLISVIWYGLAVAAGVALAMVLPHTSPARLEDRLPVLLLAVFLFWQVGPLFTLSAGWSLQLNKMLVYPIAAETLFGIEVFLRFTTAPEMLPVMAGTLVGLLRNPNLPHGWTVTLLLYVPFNLCLSLAVRELATHAFPQNRFRELFTLMVIGLSVAPQILLRSGAAFRSRPYLERLAHSAWTPWGQAAHLALGRFRPFEPVLLVALSVACFWLARLLFTRSLRWEESMRAPLGAAKKRTAGSDVPRPSAVRKFAEVLVGRPVAATVEKELRSLVRMPRFRVVFGMACVFSILVFFSFTLRGGEAGKASGQMAHFFEDNFLLVVTLYGMLILSDALMLNVFGYDRVATALYFAAPIPFASVVRAKNLVAVLILVCQAAVVLVLVLLTRIQVTPGSLVRALGSAAVAAVFLLAVGNISSVSNARPLDPAQTFRKQAGGKMQLYIFGCSLGMCVLIGSVYLAEWATEAEWAGTLVLALELAIGAIFYWVAFESATRRGEGERERLLASLDKRTTSLVD